MLKVAIQGASGFIGSRVVETFHLDQIGEVVPVVRTYAGMSRLSRFDLECRVADALDLEALTAAFEGCDLIIHCVVGDPLVILGSVQATYRAAEKCGVKRLVYLSSAAVHGPAPEPGTDETSDLNLMQAAAYNRAKARAEHKLLEARRKGAVQVVILRPGIVYGPRSRFTYGIADSLLAGTAYLIDGGSGICNAIYVDNVVQAIKLALQAPLVDGEAFLIADQEEITWADFYRPLADAFNINLADIPRPTSPEFRKTVRDLLKEVHASRCVQALLPHLPRGFKRALSAALSALKQEPVPSPWMVPEDGQVVISEEMALLQQCHYKLPHQKARDRLGYKPIVSFAEGSRRCVAWLDFVNYPVSCRPAKNRQAGDR